MNYHRYYDIDVVNGNGTRCTLFVAGCEHQCPGCYNQSTWSLTSGTPYTQALEDQIIQNLQDTDIVRQGLSLSGGDPLHPQNIETIFALIQRVKKECPGKDIWVWTGYYLNQLSSAQQKLLPYIDVLIDGPFEQDKANRSLIWKGSANQTIYYLNK